MLSARLALLPLLALLSACDMFQSDAPADEASRGASGEVLEGSISDAMLPLETLDSQPPIAAPLPGETVVTAGAEGSVEDASTAPDAAASGETVPADAEGAAEPADE